MIVEPMTRAGLSDFERMEELKKACVQASEGINLLRTGMTSETTQGIFAGATESLKQDGDLSKSTNVSLYGYNDAK
jgi:hypothetical protein